MSLIKFCLFALLAIGFAVNLNDAAPDAALNAALDAELDAALDAELDAALDVELDAVDLDAASVQPRDLASWRRKVEACVRRVDKGQLKQGEVDVLFRCIVAGLAGPLIPQAIAVRYARCVLVGSVTGPLRRAAMDVVSCVRAS